MSDSIGVFCRRLFEISMNAKKRMCVIRNEKGHRSSRTPAVYRIVVQGRLGARWSERLAGMRIVSDAAIASNPANTVLQGVIQDQAELAGIINTLYELRLSLLSVRIVDEDKNDEDKRQADDRKSSN